MSKYKRLFLIILSVVFIASVSGCKKPDPLKPAYKPYFTEHYPTKFDKNNYDLLAHFTSDNENYQEDESIDCYYQIYSPKTGIEILDNEVSSYISQLIKDTKALYDEDSGLNLNYTIEEYLDSVGKLVLYGYSAPLSNQDVKVHPVNKAFFFTKEDTQLFSFADIFSEEGMSAFRELFQDRLFEEAQIDIPLDKLPEGIIESALGFTEEGITLNFDEKVLANTQDKKISISFTWEDIADHLDDDFYKMFKAYLPRRGRELDPNKPMIALTYDDGPSKFTLPLGELAKENGGLITYFFVGNRLEKFSDSVQKVAEMGHEIGNHTWEHKNLTKGTHDENLKQIMDTSNKVKEITGKGTTLIRPPGGNYNDAVRELSKELKIPLVNWSVDTRDWESKDADKVYHEAMIHAGDGKIILMHDLYESTYEASKRIIPELVARGYQLVTVSELIEYKNGDVQYGYIYGWNK